MKHWTATAAIDRYRPTARDADTATFAARVRQCQVCPKRSGNLCGAQQKLVNVAARPAAAECPADRWSDSAINDVADEVEVRRLAVVTCYFNPCGYRRIRRNLERFLASLRMQHSDLYSVELALDQDDWILPAGPFTVRLRGSRARHSLWQKERLLNLLIERLPDCFDAVAWIDADLLFLDPEWPGRTLVELGRQSVVQLYSRVHFTDADGRIGSTLPSASEVARSRLSGQYGCPGGAWAARRSVLADGLYEANVIGGGDSAQLAAWRGSTEMPSSGGDAPALTAH